MKPKVMADDIQIYLLLFAEIYLDLGTVFMFPYYFPKPIETMSQCILVMKLLKLKGILTVWYSEIVMYC